MRVPDKNNFNHYLKKYSYIRVTSERVSDSSKRYKTSNYIVCSVFGSGSRSSWQQQRRRWQQRYSTTRDSAVLEAAAILVYAQRTRARVPRLTLLCPTTRTLRDSVFHAVAKYLFVKYWVIKATSCEFVCRFQWHSSLVRSLIPPRTDPPVFAI